MKCFISKLSDETEGYKAEYLKAKKKVHRLFEDYLLIIIANKWEAAKEFHTGRRHRKIQRHSSPTFEHVIALRYSRSN